VLAVDHEPQSVEATRRNAERNGVRLDAMQLDLLAVPPPPAPTLAANVPPEVHAKLAAALAPAVVHVIVSGFTDSEHDDVIACYAGFVQRARLGAGWQAALLERV